MVRLSVARPAYMVPSYSLTGDLLAYLKCGLQYRYQNRGALPPSTPVQLWFGQFVHALMEESYLRWRDDSSYTRFPWDWATLIRPLELEVDKRLAAAGLLAPRQQFCRSDGINAQPPCSCPDPLVDHHELLASRRVERMLATWAPHLFPLISRAEVNVRGIRPLSYAGPRRGDYYEVSGTIDVLGSVAISGAPAGNLLLHRLNAVPEIRAAINALGDSSYEVILDYKGTRRPSLRANDLEHYKWQVHTYAWLREQQADAGEVVAGILLFGNELEPSGEDIKRLKADVQAGETDIMPNAADTARIRAWRPGAPVPRLSSHFLEDRSVLIFPISRTAIDAYAGEFDGVVEDIERSVAGESTGAPITSAWSSRPSGGTYGAPEQETCTACDHKYYCPIARGAGYGGTPTAP